MRLMEGRLTATDPRLAALPSPVFVGRERELELLVEAATSAPSVVIIEGEAGIGKTRLVGELLGSTALTAHRMLAGRCHRLREPFLLGPFVEALRSIARDPPFAQLSPVVGALGPLIPELAVHLPARPEPFEDAGAERYRVFRGVLELLGALGETVLVLEDLHWADAGTVELIEFLVSQPPDGLCLVLTYRRTDIDPASAILGLASRPPSESLKGIIGLRALSAEEVRMLAASMLSVDVVSEEFGRLVHEQTAGNPFAAEQVVRLLAVRGDLVPPRARSDATPRPSGFEVPPAVRDAVLQRVALLSADGRLVVEAAAVLELTAGEELIRRVARLAPVRAGNGLCEALSAGILRDSGEVGYDFCHVLARQSVYDALPSPRRRRLHLRAAWALEAAGASLPLAQLAHHFEQAGKVRRWLYYAEQAAAACASVGEDQDAARLLGRGLSVPKLPSAARIRMAVKLGEAALFSRIPRPAIGILHGILADGSLAPGIRGELRFYLAWLLLLDASEPGSAYPQFVKAAGELRRRPGLAARVMATLATASAAAGDVSQAVGWLDQAVDAAARQSNHVVSTEVLGKRASVLLTLGDPSGWRAVDDVPWNASSNSHKLELVRVCKYLADSACSLGHYERAESFLNRADGIRRELGHGRFGVGLATVRTQLEWSMGRWDGLAARARALIEASPDAPLWSGVGELILASLQRSQGPLHEAEQGFDSLLGALPEGAGPLLFAKAASGLAMIYLARGESDAAREVVEIAVRGIPEGAWMQAHSVVPVAVDALLACGGLGQARGLAEQLARELRGRDAPAARAALAQSRGALAEAAGSHQVAARHFARAERGWVKLPSPYEAARARERRGQTLLAAGEKSGIDCLLDALQSFQDLSASWDAARVSAALRANKVALPYPWRGGPRGYGRELSPREVEVVRLVCAGNTNREIARELFLSPRTVDGHVTSVLWKLWLRSRTELARTWTDAPAHA